MMKGTSQLTCGYWNINGHRSKYLGDKLVDKEFLLNIGNCDIIGLGEIQSEGKVDIKGYKCLDQKIREKKFNGPKIAGGIGVYVKKELRHLVQVVANSCEDSIWIKVLKENLYIGTYYISPYNTKTKTFDFFKTVNDEISHFMEKGTVLVQGDLNARIGIKPDFIRGGLCGQPEDEVEATNCYFTTGSILEDENSTIEPSLRNSEDKKENSRGKDLLDICVVNDLLVVNGRKTGDIFGKYTSHNWNGSSVVDYLLCPSSFFGRISKFTVGEYIPWLSDHCLIKSDISLFVDVDRSTVREELTEEVHPGYLWDSESILNYQTGLRNREIVDKVEALISCTSIRPTNLAMEIQKLLSQVITDSEVKSKKKINSKNCSNTEPWFDKECELEKKELKSLANKMKRKPDDDTRLKVFDAKKQFKKIILAKKRRHKNSVYQKLQEQRKELNHKEFWKVFRKISPKSQKRSTQPSLSDFQKYFEKLSQTNRTQDFPDESSENGPLDYVITLKELENAGARLKLGKSTGVDNISNEMIISLLETHPKLILKLFNSILQSGEIIPEWLMGMIVAIYKDGPKMDTGNYRGITLMSCLGKLFLSILNSRLMGYVLGKDVLTVSALGFVPGNRTSDAHIIINNLINKICHKQNAKLFSCFVDFKKAFDSVPRDILLNKLLKYGINGKFFNIIRNVYLGDKACVKASGVRGTSFDINIGVRQGCVLSPLLFNIFICDLAKTLMEQENAPEVGPMSINSLFWADDLVLFSKDEEGLQNMLNILERYCIENQLSVNTKKTKCMIFNKTGRLLLRPFYLNGVQLEMVRSYKYLGFLLTPSGELKSGLKDLRDRAFRAFMKVKNDMGRSFNQDVPLALSLVDSLIKPILLYASDFWGCFKLPRSNPIQNLYMSIMKQILGVQKQTTNFGVLLELGKIPISIEAKSYR